MEQTINMQSETMSQKARKCKEDAKKRLDSKCKTKPPLPDLTLVDKWALRQFKHNAVRFLDNCHVRNSILQESNIDVTERTSDESPELQAMIVTSNIQQQTSYEEQGKNVTIGYKLADGQESKVYCDAVKELLMSSDMKKSFSEFTLTLIQNQYHLLCCIPPLSIAPCAVAVIEPFHQHCIASQDLSGTICEQSETHIIILVVHHLHYASPISLLQLVQALQTTYSTSIFDYLLFDMTAYSTPNPLDATQLILNSAGKLLMKVIPPFKQHQIGEVLYAGILPNNN